MNRLSLILPIAVAFVAAAAWADEPAGAKSAAAGPNEAPPVAEHAPPAADETPHATATADSNTRTMPIDELDNGLICEQRKRSGSRIKQTVCHTREQLAAQAQSEAQIREQMREMDRSLEILSQIEQLRRGVSSPTSGIAK